LDKVSTKMPIDQMNIAGVGPPGPTPIERSTGVSVRMDRQPLRLERLPRYTGALLRVSPLLKTLLLDNRTYPGFVGLVLLANPSIIAVDNEPPGALDRTESLLEISRLSSIVAYHLKCDP
ncbi:unnamed protein product, partial [Heterotrigona itama]